MLMMMVIQWYNIFTQNIRLQNLSVHFRFLSSSSGNDANNWRPHGQPCMANACDWLKNDAAVTMSTEKYCLLSPAWNWLDGFTHNASTQRRPGIFFSSTHSTLLCTENLITHRKLLHKRFYKTTFYTWMLLYTKALTNKNLSHTHTNAFAHKRFDTQKLLRTRTDTEQTFTHTHTNAFTQKTFAHITVLPSESSCTQKLWHTESVHTQMVFLNTNSFYTQKFLHTHTSSTHRKLLHTQVFTHRKLVDTEAFTHGKPLHTERFYTQTLVHTGSFTHKNSFTRTLTHKYIYTQTAFTHRHRQLLHTETSEVLSGKIPQVEQTNLLRLEAQWEFWILWAHGTEL